jgi:TonB family protein
VSGDTQVSFVVEPDGRVTRPALLSSLGTAIDEAILDAVLRLPRFEPGRQRGQAVAVRLRVPVSIQIH